MVVADQVGSMWHYFQTGEVHISRPQHIRFYDTQTLDTSQESIRANTQPDNRVTPVVGERTQDYKRCLTNHIGTGLVYTSVVFTRNSKYPELLVLGDPS